MMDKSTAPVYFKSFNSLRFIAAALVLLYHSKVFLKTDFDYDHPLWHAMFMNGGLAVSFFFVLSGFLITFLLFAEIEKTNTVSVKKFYLKRILRIWPIYYLYILIVQFILPGVFNLLHQPYQKATTWSTVFYLLVLPNVPHILRDGGKMSHLWSIGVEEQFYLIWAPMVKYLKQYFVPLCILLILLKKTILMIMSINTLDDSFTFQFIDDFKLEQLAIGGLGAYYLQARPEQFKKLMFSNTIRVTTIILLFSLLAFGEGFRYNSLVNSFVHLCFSVLGYVVIPLTFLSFMVNLSLNDKSPIRLHSVRLERLGTISYGFYIYLVLILVNLIISRWSLPPLLFDIALIILGLGLTTLISRISYDLFELYFLKFRPA
jgi:peptidoglycan/LPS O-acetylase OafA/YrhL